MSISKWTTARRRGQRLIAWFKRTHPRKAAPRMAVSRRMVVVTRHLVTAIVLAVTIVGIPFAWAHLKLAGLALWPIGKAIVPVQNARLASS